MENLLRADPALAVAAGGAVLTALSAVDLDPALLDAVEAHLPRHGQVDLDAGIAAFTRRRTAHRLAATADLAEHARLYQDLAFRLLRAGDREEAVAVAGQAVDVLRRLAADDAATYEPALGTALAQLSEHAYAADQLVHSRQAAEEAVGIFRRLTAADPTAYDPGLAVSLSHLGQGMAEARAPDEALAATQRAMGIFQRLAATDPATYEPGLAMTLANAAIYSWKLPAAPDGSARESAKAGPFCWQTRRSDRSGRPGSPPATPCARASGTGCPTTSSPRWFEGGWDRWSRPRTGGPTPSPSIRGTTVSNRSTTRRSTSLRPDM